MFRVLIVDDNPTELYLFERMLRTAASECGVEWAHDGGEALDLLYRRKEGSHTPLPDVILMDINMPRVDGVEALAAIKGDPELCVIPVIMFSTAALPEQVRKSYQAGANSFVQKPTSLRETEELMRAIHAFWKDFTILPLRDDGGFYSTDSSDEDRSIRLIGRPVASSPREVKSGSAHSRESATMARWTVSEPLSNTPCEEHRRLLDEMGRAVGELLKLHDEQFRAIVQGDSDCDRFDLLIHMASEKKQQAKYAYLRHLELHGCSRL